MSKILESLQQEVNEAIELQKEWVLKWEKANELMTKLRNATILEEFKDNIIKLKFEQLQNSIDTLWRDRRWYNVWDNFSKRKLLLDIQLSENNSNITQKYFWEWNEIEIISNLKTLFPIAKSKILIYDNYINWELVKTLSNVNKWIEIKIITIEDSKKNKLEKQIEAFNILYENNIKVKYLKKWEHPSHDRFYIIDDSEKVFSIWSSIWEKIRATLFTPIDKEQWENIINDFNKWWNWKQP